MTLTVLGTFTADGRLQVTYGGRTVGDLTMAFLHDGLPPPQAAGHLATADHAG